ncbi:BatA domain-containing protein [Gramella lutea]|uniref:BatA domain-containing protein n=1 Tax=Christiangramia lutea TaxID=1607951 RepID=A0A9X2A928_9FLAO|nr:BatA domain-containing protein [Christiangramia lutea]MCH4822970.1 BatA domain-containing protein [Christiangramia lutea]
MHFEQPELLYALFLLIIPIIVHLFRLRKFQKEDFTNVKFLKKVIQETRKSSRLKKFLILFTRLLLLGCLILAFAKPFIPASEKALSESRTLIYLDNSYSMQAGKDQSAILNKAINSLIENIDENDNTSVFTNNQDYFGKNAAILKDELQDIEFDEKQINFREIELKAQNYFKNHPNSDNDLVIISDFQHKIDIPAEITNKDFNYHLVKLKSPEIQNASLDTAFIEETTPETVTLKIGISSNESIDQPLSVSVYNGENLLGRNTVQLESDSIAEINFRLQNETITDGIIEIDDSGLNYDNRLYFHLDENPEIKVVNISSSETNFLDRIYTQPEFQLKSFNPGQIDFNSLNSANLVILNEIDQLPSSLLNNLNTVKNNGASIVLIPADNFSAYAEILNRFGFSSFDQRIDSERLITSITYDHPLFQNVFEDRIDNFEYPKVVLSFNLNSANSILSYQDNRPFLVGSNSVYVFTAPLNSSNSNFINSPLIVPVFYQIGLNSLKMNQLYFSTTTENEIDIPVNLEKDQVLHLKNSEIDIIPQQQNFSNRVEINTGNIELNAGNYQITNNNNSKGAISFNNSRDESDLRFSELSNFEGSKVYDSVEEFFRESNAATEITALWKWFAIFALIFLGIEMLLIKFFK